MSLAFTLSQSIAEAIKQHPLVCVLFVAQWNPTALSLGQYLETVKESCGFACYIVDATLDAQFCKEQG
jgi:hypothetical protein